MGNLIFLYKLCKSLTITIKFVDNPQEVFSSSTRDVCDNLGTDKKHLFKCGSLRYTEPSAYTFGSGSITCTQDKIMAVIEEVL